MQQTNNVVKGYTKHTFTAYMHIGTNRHEFEKNNFRFCTIQENDGVKK